MEGVMTYAWLIVIGFILLGTSLVMTWRDRQRSRKQAREQVREVMEMIRRYQQDDRHE